MGMAAWFYWPGAVLSNQFTVSDFFSAQVTPKGTPRVLGASSSPATLPAALVQETSWQLILGRSLARSVGDEEARERMKEVRWEGSGEPVAHFAGTTGTASRRSKCTPRRFQHSRTVAILLYAPLKTK